MLPAGHGAFATLQLGRRVAAELAGEAIDPEADLTMADRLALTTLALAVDLEVSRRAGVEPIAEAREILAGALAVRRHGKPIRRRHEEPIPPA